MYDLVFTVQWLWPEESLARFCPGKRSVGTPFRYVYLLVVQYVSGKEWTGEPHDVSFFRATSCNTDQWARTAKEAGMNYILFLTKHHDGFCLWDTQTTELKVTNAPLKTDVLQQLRASCDKYGIKLALYFSEGDWNWPGAERGQSQKGGSDPEMKKAQLKELLTRYGPIEFIWFDHAVGDGGLSHEETTEWVHQSSRIVLLVTIMALLQDV